MNSRVYGFIGCGNMAQALIRGMIAKKLTIPENVFCSSPKEDIALLEKMGELGCRTTTENGQVTVDSKVLILAVKPPIIPIVLKEISSRVTPEHLVISIAMGITTKVIEKLLPEKTRVIRAMPNTPALVMEGASIFSCGSATLDDDSSTALEIFSSVGFCEKTQENLLDAVTGLSGGGPAYLRCLRQSKIGTGSIELTAENFKAPSKTCMSGIPQTYLIWYQGKMYMAIEAMADGAVKMGIGRDLALKLAARTMLGSARMVLETGSHPAFLKDSVCSPGGTTIHAVHELEKSGFRAALMSAIEAATLKAITTRDQ